MKAAAVVLTYVSGALILAALISFFWMRPAAHKAQITHGRGIYLEHCASCHGAHLEGQARWQEPREDGRMPAPPHDASGHTWHHADHLLFQITKEGMSAVVEGHESDMPPFKDVLSDKDIWAVLAFLKSTWPERERQYQEERTRLKQ